MLNITYGSKGRISFEMASNIAASITTGVMTAVYAQIKPDDLGKDLRDLHVARAYGERLIKHGGNATEDTVKHLVEGYPTHGFIIDASEAKDLFKAVVEPPQEITELFNILDLSLLDPTRRPCYVKRLDTVEEISGETTIGAGEGDTKLDDIRERAGKENRGGSRKAGTEPGSPLAEHTRKSA